MRSLVKTEEQPGSSDYNRVWLSALCICDPLTLYHKTAASCFKPINYFEQYVLIPPLRLIRAFSCHLVYGSIKDRRTLRLKSLRSLISFLSAEQE